MDQLKLFLNTNGFSNISKQCSVHITDNVSIPSLKLDQNYTQNSKSKLKDSVYLINFDYDDVRKNGLVDETWEAISQLVRRFIGIVLNEYWPSSTLADVLLETQQQVMFLGNVLRDMETTKDFWFKFKHKS